MVNVAEVGWPRPQLGHFATAVPRIQRNATEFTTKQPIHAAELQRYA